ncbi:MULTISPECIES: hypothetical protein [unclassified Streptomyces]|uniref:hypothetical protein n=1 Tax=unclassified Streptomyces TaxID=2593676 RepID=UPI00225AEAEC|nr:MULTISPECIES: hypothetical protein [unclassified Streptomyces]MCX4988689.1 hypothetical protein [Streptomyces sp. NBC_00568]MCX5006089.1 hypothetical protein [Streptomyces sp. NBC_00638]
MHWYLVGFAALIVTAQAGLGIAAITLDRVPPWLRRRVLRPKLWGAGALAGAVGMSLFLFLGPFHGPDADLTPYAMSGIALFIASLVLQALGQRPGREAVPPDPRPR